MALLNWFPPRLPLLMTTPLISAVTRFPPPLGGARKKTRLRRRWQTWTSADAARASSGRRKTIVPGAFPALRPGSDSSPKKNKEEATSDANWLCRRRETNKTPGEEAVGNRCI